MSTFVLLPGAGSDSWYWHRVVPLLAQRGHTAMPVDLPYGDDQADQRTYADIVVAAIRDAERPLIVVGQSMSAFTAVLVAERVPLDELVLVAPMIPAPGESPGLWWGNVGHEEAKRTQDVLDGRDPATAPDPLELFFHDVPVELRDQAFAREESRLSDNAFEPQWEAEGWPDVPVRVIAGRHDRLFPLPFLTRLANERLGVEPETVDSGHLPALVCPSELTELLLARR
ncbi:MULTISPECIES: alpha/beta fold hydrolase [unclassified Rhodococcus (in: high G+C Gram-positive bacteria)]|uniref:alpha/beta fold hydrolase n=1 Tax=Rhodococcus sp. SJ-3 TaxID=3454628 RepID=UPI003F79C6E2